MPIDIKGFLGSILIHGIVVGLIPVIVFAASPRHKIVENALSDIAKINAYITDNAAVPDIDVDLGGRYPSILPRDIATRSVRYRSYVNRNGFALKVEVVSLAKAKNNSAVIRTIYWVWDKDSLKSLISTYFNGKIDEIHIFSTPTITKSKTNKCIEYYDKRIDVFDDVGRTIRIIKSRTTVDHIQKTAKEATIMRSGDGKIVKKETHEWDYWEYACDKPCCDPPRPGEHAE